MVSQLHALLIDDDTKNLAVLAEMLAVENITSTQVSDPTDLGNVLAKMKRVDLVFLDLEMPDVDGYQVLDMLKNEAQIACPIIACTVHLNEVNNARRLGFHSFLGKPLDIDRFPQQLARILNDEPVWEVF
jgi:CheY-like chemotaxis protein